MRECVGCGSICRCIESTLSDHFPLCSACFELARAAGVLPFVPGVYSTSLRMWIYEQTVLLDGRRIGNGRRWRRS